MVLKPTSGANKQEINQALQNLQAGGSTAGGEGIQLAYKIAKESFIKMGIIELFSLQTGILMLG